MVSIDNTSVNTNKLRPSVSVRINEVILYIRIRSTSVNTY